MKLFLLGVVSTLLILSLGAVLYLRLGFAEVRADVPPPAWEPRLLRPAVLASIRREAPEARNPISPTNENLIAGGRKYLGNCSGCHGTPGKPDSAIPDSLYPPIPQFPEMGTPLTEAQIFWVAKHGIRRTGMFANGKFYPDEDLWRITAYVYRIKSLPPEVAAALAKPEPAN
jgi:mono/diheme cytochrome c family protein